MVNTHRAHLPINNTRLVGVLFFNENQQSIVLQHISVNCTLKDTVGNNSGKEWNLQCPIRSSGNWGYLDNLRSRGNIGQHTMDPSWSEIKRICEDMKTSLKVLGCNSGNMQQSLTMWIR
jgi:hypothetical protein